ncbi:hypothetical protein F4809DRAFT_602034 [Biscogniauxia mediterranea]|nr:hypothetical protein F4809DRAFT_602034 [Biscogniauxia mediterranea]
MVDGTGVARILDFFFLFLFLPRLIIACFWSVTESLPSSCFISRTNFNGLSLRFSQASILQFMAVMVHTVAFGSLFALTH